MARNGRLKKEILLVIIAVGISMMCNVDAAAEEYLDKKDILEVNENIEDNAGQSEMNENIADDAKLSEKTEEAYVVGLDEDGMPEWRPVLYPDVMDETSMRLNTQHLQAAIDAAFKEGGGRVVISAGNFYFTPLKRNFNTEGSVLKVTDTNYIEYHVIKCKDNVTLAGTLNEDGSLGTKLLPVGTMAAPIDMFYFADLFEKGDDVKPNYLVNAHFKDFCIDGINTRNTGYYNAKGKGFYFCLFRDCSWDNVTVMNTDGTGFGMDCPLNSSITNCTAIGCGKQASIQNVGASGFGIGIGFSKKESLTIENCTAIGNRKFGIFFEHQRRFSPEFKAMSAAGFIVKNSAARGNLYDFGGELCNDVTYIDCVSEPVYETDPNPLGSVTERAYYFGTWSKDYQIYENGREVKLWEANKKYYKDVDGWFVEEGWFDTVLDMGIMYGYTDYDGQPNCIFGQNDPLARAQIAVTLFRYCNPNKKWNDTAANMTPFQDNMSGQFYTEAMNWAYKEGIFTGDRNLDGSMTGNVRPGDSISRQELALVLYRFAKSQGADMTHYDHTLYLEASGADQVGDWAKDAVAWCYAYQILTGGTMPGTGLMPTEVATRAHAGKMIPQTIKVFNSLEQKKE